MSFYFNPYISFNGNCEQAFCFYKSVFGGDFTKLIRYSDMQNESGVPTPPEEFGYQIRHIELPVYDNLILMGSDNTDTSSIDNIKMGNNMRISILSDNEDELKRLFEALSSGGVVKAPLCESLWGTFYGSLIDKFGIHWAVELRKDKQPLAFEDNSNIHIP
ncbi:MAG: VOC family protein [Dysgonamonadaceae bacterium]|jgi:PhnB protein|nr:VOC family protein [Dysgonamonadaceae bacterium]